MYLEVSYKSRLWNAAFLSQESLNQPVLIQKQTLYRSTVDVRVTFLIELLFTYVTYAHMEVKLPKKQVIVAQHNSLFSKHNQDRTMKVQCTWKAIWRVEAELFTDQIMC